MKTFKEIAELLSRDTIGILRMLFPSAQFKNGKTFKIGNVNGDKGDSLVVELEGRKAGLWYDHATDQGGDLLQLWADVKGISLRDAIQEAKRKLNISEPEFHQRKKSYSKPTKKLEIKKLSPVENYLINERKLNKETLEKYRVGEDGRVVAFNYYRDNELFLIKYVKLDRDEKGKKKSWVEENCEPILFGWDCIKKSSRNVIICEGEIDCMSFYQYGLPALSVPFGCNSLNWLESEFDRLSIFDEIFLCFDNDKAGDAGVQKVISSIGRHRCKIVTLPFKDANECLKNGVKQKEIFYCLDNARTVDPAELKRADYFREHIRNKIYREPENVGYDTPWPSLDNKVNFRPQEISIWTGINGHGKSQFLGHLILHQMKKGAKVCVASLEMPVWQLIKRLNKQCGAVENVSEEYFDVLMDWYGEDRLWIFNLLGTAKSEKLLETFKYAVMKYGIDVFIIDSYMKLEVSEEEYKIQHAFLDKICDFKNEFNCHVHFVVHPKKIEDEYRIPGKMDIKGLGTITDMADNVFSLWRNKLKEEANHKLSIHTELNSAETKALNQADVYFSCVKQRHGEWEGLVGFGYHVKTFQYLWNSSVYPKSFVENTSPKKEEEEEILV